MRLLLCLALLLAPVAARAQAPSIETAAEARARDAAEYAKQFGVPQAEAERCLAAQEASVAATDRLAERYRDRLTGIVIEHKPRWQIVVYLTGTAPVPEQRIVAGGVSVPIVFRTGTRATRERAVYAMTYHQGAIRAALPDPPGMGYDPRTGALVVTVGAAPGGVGALEAKLGVIAGVPVEVRVIERVDVDLSPAGGARVVGTNPDDGKRYICTTGFTVTDGKRNAVTTAALDSHASASAFMKAGRSATLIRSKSPRPTISCDGAPMSGCMPWSAKRTMPERSMVRIVLPSVSAMARARAASWLCCSRRTWPRWRMASTKPIAKTTAGATTSACAMMEDSTGCA